VNLENLTKQDLKYVLCDFISAASDNYQETMSATEDEMQAGRQLAYFEMLDMLRSRILIAGGEMNEIPLPPDLLKNPLKASRS